MFRTFLIAVLTGLILLLAGCEGPVAKEKPVWEQVKIGDLAPKDMETPVEQAQNTINFDIYIFDIPVEDANVLDDVWMLLYTQPLRFNDYDAFEANLFAAGFNEAATWDLLGDILRLANAKKTERDSIILLDGQLRDFPITTLDAERTIFYTSAAGRSEGVTIGPGSMALRLKARKIPGQRGVCEMSVLPIFSPFRKSRVWLATKGDDTATFAFDALGFTLKMGQGDFFMLGQQKYTPGQTGLVSFFFVRDEPRPATRLYMFVCGGIAD